MDADGNLTTGQDFTESRRFRFISRLGDNFAVGIIPDSEGGGTTGVSYVSADTPSNSIFLGYGANDIFSLRWPAQEDAYLCADDSGSELFISWFPVISPNLPAQPSVFAVNFVDGFWFELNAGWNKVLDCLGSNTNAGNPIDWWEPNGGANQQWRATTVGPGF